VERQLWQNWLARVAYVGSHGSHIYIAEELNPAIYTPGSTLGTDARRVYQGFSTISLANQSGNAHFNALELTVDKTFSHGLTFRANYTWSKSLDDLPVSWGAQGPIASQSWVYPWYYPNADLLDRGPSQFDHRHRFVSTYVWQLALLRRCEFARPAYARRMADYRTSSGTDRPAAHHCGRQRPVDDRAQRGPCRHYRLSLR
jgi:hypothetical protein